ncbi:MAG: general stress protein CsbD [Bacteroidales bacterium]|nr:general stress protein CsbD [Bacteroidales bacterium]MCF8455695.1 general stress protein CsbD [Bacteroidales bacterium]
MNTTQIERNWIEMQTKLKLKFTTLTDDDLKLIEGKKGEMIGRLQIKLGKTKEEMYNIIAVL